MMRQFLCLLASILPLLLSAAPGRRNVLFIVADDLNCAIGPYGDPHALTPNLDRLASQGLTFRRAYCQQAVCNPSRSSFLTGRYPDTTGVTDLRAFFRTRLPDVVTLPQAFLNDGYFSQGIGKIYHNMGDTSDRRSWSVDEILFHGTHAQDTLFAQAPEAPGRPKYKAPVTEAGDVPDTAYRDGRITEQAVHSLGRMNEKDKPFFLAVGYWRPHLPFVAPKRYWDLHDPETIRDANPLNPPGKVPAIALHPNKEIHGYGLVPKQDIDAKLRRHLRHGYYASVSFLDAQVGALLDAIAKNQLAKDTIIVFTSDHGFHLGEHGLWAKTTNFELDARVPLIIADPSRPDSHGRSSDSLVELVDLLPTLTDLAGVPTPAGHQGTSLVPVLDDPAASVKKHAFTQHQHPFYGGRKATHQGYSVRTDRWRYTEWWNLETGKLDERELYDHQKDPLETVNAATAYPAVTEELSKVIQQQFRR